MELLDQLIHFIKKVARHLWYGNSGHLAHLIIGMLIAALAAHFLFRSSSSRTRAFLLGLAIATVIGLLKELIDPFIGRQRDLFDFVFTVFGGMVGAATVFSGKYLKKVGTKQ